MAIDWATRRKGKARLVDAAIDNAPVKEFVAPVIETRMRPPKDDITPKPLPGNRSTPQSNYALNGAGSVAVGGGQRVKVLDANAMRQWAGLTNIGTSGVYISFTDNIAYNAGVWISPNGGSFEFGLSTDCPYTGVVYAFATPSSTTVTFIEL